MLELFNCRLCGGELKPETDETYRCEHCGRIFIKTAEEGYVSSLKELFNEEKLERISAARQNLWAAMHERYINSGACIDYARVLKVYLPRDYYANFAELANQDNDSVISKFLNDSVKEDMDVYADAVLDFMLKSLTAGTINAVCIYIDRAYSKTSAEYIKYINLFEKEAEKVESGIYELGITRDVFLAYSSADIDEVISLCDLLEGQGISCFFSMRNLRHGRGAADNYDTALKTAMDNCLVVVFLSSKDSRNLSCDAFKKELQYMRVRDIENAPSEYRNLSYDKLPAKYKKPRVEYLLDDYKRTAADIQTKQIFDGYEWCKTAEDVAVRVTKYISSTPGTDDDNKGSEKENLEFKISIETKEQNVLEHVRKLFELGYYSDADKSLDDLENEEIKELKAASAAVYYYKILSSHKVSSDSELIKKLSDTDSNLKNDKNYVMAQLCDSGFYKTRINKIEKIIENRIEEKNRQQEKQQLSLERKQERDHIHQDRILHHTSVRAARKAYRESVAKSSKFTPSASACVLTVYAALGLAFGLSLGIGAPTIGLGVFLIVFGGIGVLGCLFSMPQWIKTEKKIKIPIYVIIGVAVVFTVFGILFIPGTFGTKTDTNGISYKQAISYCYVVDYDGESQYVDVPSKFNGKYVTRIETDAFKNNTTITEVTISNTSNIQKSAFEGCTSLESVNVGSGVSKIKKSTFLDCESLKSVNLNDGVKTISEDSFSNCGSLVSIDLTGVTEIKSGAFSFCYSLEQVIFSDGLYDIGEKAFEGCTSLTELTFPSSLSLISKYAFNSCSNLKSIVFEDPTNWERDGKYLSSSSLGNPTTAASMLVGDNELWYKKKK